MTTLQPAANPRVTSVSRYERLLGCLLGTALGDAVGLPREGLSRRRAAKWYGLKPLHPNLIAGKGFCSDDTEHSQIVGRALALSRGNVPEFEREFARQLRCWIATLPAGVGLATLRACLKLLVGFPPAKSGVFRAGNGPAMRSAIIGAWAAEDEQLRKLVHASTRITHTDPRAEEGALLVARAAGQGNCRHPIDFLREHVATIDGEELRRYLEAVCKGLEQNDTPEQFADSQGWLRGISGYVNHTVPAALYCWAWAPDDFRRCIESAVRLGGDTDSVAAIAGGIWGANAGSERLPAEWVARLSEWPRGIDWMKRLAEGMADPSPAREREIPSMRWGSTLPRNFLFATVVVMLGFRRLLPPY